MEDIAIEGLTLKVNATVNARDDADQPTAVAPGGPEHINAARSTPEVWDVVASEDDAS